MTYLGLGRGGWTVMTMIIKIIIYETVIMYSFSTASLKNFYIVSRCSEETLFVAIKTVLG